MKAAVKTKTKRQSVEERIADTEDTPEKIAWFIENVRRRRAEFGWVNESEEDVDERQERSRI